MACKAQLNDPHNRKPPLFPKTVFEILHDDITRISKIFTMMTENPLATHHFLRTVITGE